MKFITFVLAIIVGSTYGLPTALESAIETDLHDVERRAVAPHRCLTRIYVMAFTSGIRDGGSDSHHSIEILASGSVRNVRLYDRPGDDMYSNKGDIWKINFSSFHFPDSCIRISEIQNVAIIETNNDGWHIDSIVTMVKDSQGGVQILTQNLDVNHWIDGNRHYSHRRLQLTFA